MLAGSMNTVSPVLLIAVDDAGHLVAMVDRDGQDVMVAVDGRVRVAQDAAQLGVAEQPADLGLHLLVEVGELLPDRGEVAAGHVEHVPAAVDAAADRLADRAEVFDAREHLDQAGEVLREPHPVAVDRPGAVQALGRLRGVVRP